MNVPAPPGKRGSRPGGAANLGKLLLTDDGADFYDAQGITWRHWEIEAGRLFSLFWQTANAKHLRAFAAHVAAMRRFAGRRRK